MNRSSVRHLVAAGFLAVFSGFAAAEEIGVVLADFEQPDSASNWTWYWGRAGNAAISESSAERHQGAQSARIDYAFSEADGNFTLQCGTPIPPNPTFLRLWVRSDNSGHALALRIIDRTGETFLYPLARALDWTGWRLITVTAGGPAQTWSGNKDGLIDLPARIALQMNGKRAGEGTIYIDEVEVGSWLDDDNRIELTAGSDLFGNVWFGKQNVVKVPFKIRDRGGAAANLVFDYQVCDNSGKILKTGKESLVLDAGRKMPVDVAVPIETKERFDYYTISATVSAADSGKVLQTLETTAAVVPQPALVPPSLNPFGMNLSLSTRHAPPERAAGAAMARKSGIGWTREEFSWEKIESVKGKYAWSAYDDAMRHAAKENLGVLGLIGYAASWARRDPAQYTSPPRDVKDYADFVYQVVSRYKGQVKYWEIWNEPDSPVFWPPKADAAEYTALLKAAYAAAKRADPDCRILSAGLLVGMNHFKNWTYLDAMYTNGVADAVDILGWHAYCDPKSPAAGLYEELSQTLFERMKNHGDGDKHAWLTEQGWPTLKGFNRSVTEEQQAAYAVQAHVLALSNKSVDKYFWFILRDGGNRESDPEQSYGIMNPDGTPKPAYGAYVAMIQMLLGKTPKEPLDLAEKATCRIFADEKETVFVLWSATGDAFAFPTGLIRENVTLHDALGNDTPFDDRHSLSSTILYLTTPTQNAARIRSILAGGQN